MNLKKYPSKPDLDAELFTLFQNGRSDGKLAMQFGLPLEEVKVRVKRGRSLRDQRRSRATALPKAVRKEPEDRRAYERLVRLAGHGFRDVG